MNMNPNISVVVPLFNEAESLPELYAWIKRVMDTNKFTYEIIFVNDGSTLDYIKIAVVLTAGTAFLLWLGDQITQKGSASTSFCFASSAAIASRHS